MWFTTIFKRRVGAGGTEPVLGSDGAPTTRAEIADDNTHASTFSNINGWPAHRIAVSYRGPAGALPLPCTIFIFDELSEAWFQVPQPAAVTLAAGQLRFLDIPGVLPPPQRGSSQPTQGGLEVYVRVEAAGGDPDGLYVFTVASDLTTVAV